LTGRYDAAHQIVVRLRPRAGRAGAHVLTPLVGADGTALLVDRGFVEQAGAVRTVPDAPDPPSGEVEVVARLRLSEEGRGTGGDPATGAVRHVDVDGIAATLPYPVYGAWGELVRQDPPPEAVPEPPPAPQLDAGPHLGYAYQWFLFAVVAVVGFVLLVRSEWRSARTAAPADGSRAAGSRTGRRDRRGAGRGSGPGSGPDTAGADTREPVRASGPPRSG
jgi:cytochrome oxidase assembly protein ShyY1